jgi:protein-S-isoprenylcysteine O-methyltransferase Ste14
VSPDYAIYIPWDIWIVSWVAAAIWANRTLKRPGGGRELPYFILEIGGFFMLLSIVSLPSSPLSANPVLAFLATRYWTLPTGAAWTMVAVASAGFLFCWWARIHLGKLWSGRVTRKEGHHIVDTGPYALVRHPIYTGVLTAAIATAAVKGSTHALIGVGMLLVAYQFKARLEERFLSEELGTDSYAAYRRRVPMLIPFAPR